MSTALRLQGTLSVSTETEYLEAWDVSYRWSSTSIGWSQNDIAADSIETQNAHMLRTITTSQKHVTFTCVSSNRRRKT